tara:strand:- start:635 stop:838 length:204 start_codon:yes stop_codon:yes gene_type:complete
LIIKPRARTIKITGSQGTLEVMTSNSDKSQRVAITNKMTEKVGKPFLEVQHHAHEFFSSVDFFFMLL